MCKHGTSNSARHVKQSVWCWQRVTMIGKWCKNCTMKTTEKQVKQSYWKLWQRSQKTRHHVAAVIILRENTKYKVVEELVCSQKDNRHPGKNPECLKIETQHSVEFTASAISPTKSYKHFNRQIKLNYVRITYFFYRGISDSNPVRRTAI